MSAADDEVSTAEENVIRQIANELSVEQDEFVEARRKVRDKRAVFKG